MKHLPTIKDVASAAGVHFTTVSMALRYDPRIRAETRNRVLAAALRTGYQRNPVSGALSMRRQSVVAAKSTPRIAFVSNRSPENGFYRRDYIGNLLRGARDKAQALGYEFEVIFVDDGHHDSQSLYRYLKEQAISGLIIGAFEPDRSELSLPWDEFCVVQIDSRHHRPSFTFVSHDQMHAVRLAFANLRRLGYRRVGLAVGAHDPIVTANLPGCGYLLELFSVRPADRLEPLLFPPNVGMKAAARIVAEWVREVGADAVICNWMMIGRLLRLGGAPRGVGSACMCLQRPAPQIAGVVSNTDLVGSQLTSRLAALLQSESYGVPATPTSTYVEGFWHDGTSAPDRN
ncbi:MAG TPA: LacI family DNA-binding transcriptional regulator [Candidatus Didemnitutus sp.]|jgi:LacI family transcriptional regulator